MKEGHGGYRCEWNGDNCVSGKLYGKKEVQIKETDDKISQKKN